MADDRQLQQVETQIEQARDAKAKPHLEQYAPVWLVEQRWVVEDSSVVFNVVFHHNRYGWVNRRYKYDGFNDVLYYSGQNVLDEDEATEITLGEPYIRATVADTVNAYGG